MRFSIYFKAPTFSRDIFSNFWFQLEKGKIFKLEKETLRNGRPRQTTTKRQTYKTLSASQNKIEGTPILKLAMVKRL